MSKRTKIILLIYLLAVTIGFLLPFILKKENPLTTSLDIVRSVSIFATSIFALLYFDPFGIKKKGIEKQYEKVLEVLESIVGIVIKVKWTVDQETEHAGTILVTKKHMKWIFSEVGFFKDIQDNQVTFDFDEFISIHSNLVKLKNNIWTPKEISSEMSFFELTFPSKLEMIQGTRLLMTWNTWHTVQHYTSQINGQSYTLKNFISKYEVVLKKCEDWLERNSYSNHQLNL